MKLCMFHPRDHPLERGWVGRIDGEQVVHLAAQTLQSFFLGGGGAREHAVYRLDEVTLLAPVLHPPAVRVFDGPDAFAFANPAAVVGPGSRLTVPEGGGPLAVRPRVAAVIGADGAIGGFSAFADWRAPGLQPPKDRDFGSGLGPVVVTPDEFDSEAAAALVRVDGVPRAEGPASFDWERARDAAARGTTLRPGDVLAAASAVEVARVGPGDLVEVEISGVGVLSQRVAA